MVLRDGENPLFEGVFIKDGDIHHVKLLSKYNSLKNMDDVDLPDADPNETMVVYRDSDRFIAQALLLGRSIDGIVSSEEANSSMCGHDRLTFNTQGNVPSRGFGWDTWDTFNRLVRRQSDVGGSLATGGSKTSLAATIGNTAGCPSTRQVALVAAAADCTYVQAHGNATTTRAQIISIYNSVYACNT
jgi:hypothetical protein